MNIHQDFNKWFYDKGDDTLMLDHNLTEDSNVLEIGGYKGVWVSQIVSKYNPNVFIFEPVKEYYNYLCDKFLNNKKVKIFNCGVCDKTEKINISLIDDGSSLISNSDNKQSVDIVSFDDMLKITNLKNIDLVQINIEGAEYNLLEHIFKNNLYQSINKFLIQYHTNIIDCDVRRSNIQNCFENVGYHKVFDYPFIWEGWMK